MEFLQPGRPVRWWLRWAAWLYGIGVQVRWFGIHAGWVSPDRLPCRVISVGNLTVGGTGKTPVVILLVEWLLAQGRRVAVLSRGYKRSGRSPYVLVSDGTRILAGPAEAGDEPVLIARRCPKALVAVGADRAALGRWVLQQFSVDCVVLDDGFQRRSLHRDLDIVLLDATDAAGLDALLPAGRLREPVDGVARAHVVAVTRADARDGVQAIQQRIGHRLTDRQHQVEIVFRPEALVSVSAEGRQALEWCRGRRVWLVSGIGNHQAFRRSVEALGAIVLGETAFGDHHEYGHDDVQSVRSHAAGAQAEVVLTTEKDAVKLTPLLTPADAWWAVRLQAGVVRGEERLRRLILGEGTRSNG